MVPIYIHAYLSALDIFKKKSTFKFYSCQTEALVTATITNHYAKSETLPKLLIHNDLKWSDNFKNLAIFAIHSFFL